MIGRTIKNSFIMLGYIIGKRIFGYTPPTTEIPSGGYCYDITKRASTGCVMYAKPCKYYKRITRDRVGCGYMGGIYYLDFLLSDQCKICGVNEYEEKDILG